MLPASHGHAWEAWAALFMSFDLDARRGRCPCQAPGGPPSPRRLRPRRTARAGTPSSPRTARRSAMPRSVSCPMRDGREIVEDREIRLQESERARPTIVEHDVMRQDARAGPRDQPIIGRSARTGRGPRRGSAATAREIVRQTNCRPARVSASRCRPASASTAARRCSPAGTRRATPRLEFDNFNLDAMAIEQVVIAPRAGAPPTRRAALTLLRTRYDGGAAALGGAAAARPRAPHRRGRPADVRHQHTIRPTDRETALRPHPPYQVDAQCDDRARPSGFRTKRRAAISATASPFDDGLAFAVPQTGEQRVAGRRASGVTVDICADLRPRPADRPGLSRRRAAPTAWLQSDRSRGPQAIAAPVARHRSLRHAQDGAAARARQALSLQLDFGGHYSALERSGAAPATAPRRRSCSRRSAGRRASRPGWSTAWSIRGRVSRRQQRLPAAQLDARLCRRRLAQLRSGARHVRRDPYRADRRRRRRALDPGRQPARQPAPLGRDERSRAAGGDRLP